MDANPLQQIIAVKRRHEQALMRLPNVVAVGVGLRARGGVTTDEACIVVSVRRKVPLAELPAADRVPGVLDGVAVDVVATGDIRAG